MVGLLHPASLCALGARARRCAAAVVCLLMLAACGSKTANVPKLGPGDVILAFGDSLTYGTGAAEAESYPAVLAQLTGLRVVREGVPGEVTAEGRRRLASALDAHKPKLLLLCLGGNDMLRRVDDATIASNLREMIRTAKTRGVSVVLLGVPKPALFGGPAKFYGELAQEFSLAYESEVLNKVLKEPAMKADPIHPNAQGYRVMAEAVAALLKRAGAL